MNIFKKNIKVFDITLKKDVVIFIDNIASLEINSSSNDCDVILKGNNKTYNISIDDMERIFKYIQDVNYLERTINR